MFLEQHIRMISEGLCDCQATFTQQQNTVVSPVFESLIRLRSHTVLLFTGVTTAFCNF